MIRTKARFRHLKAVASGIVFHPLLGKLLARACRNRIPSRGFLFDVNSPLISDKTKAALWWGRFETADCRLVEEHWRSDLDTLQLGGGIGVVASQMARRLGTDRLIVCVEANPLLMKLLESNLNRNAPHVRRVFHNAAIDYSGSKQLEFTSSREFLYTSVTKKDAGPVCRVRTTKLSELLTHDLSGAFQLQMDIEGAEAGVFLCEPPGTFEQCYQVLIELHDTGFDNRRFSVEDLIAAARDIHGLHVETRYGPVVLLRHRATNRAAQKSPP
jgi:FkbM family methyltransferase